LRGSSKVGTYALVQVVAVCIPFIILVAAALFHFGDWSLVGQAFTSPNAFKISPSQIAAGLAIVIWNYSGWDNISTYADEIQQPERVIPRSLAITIVLVVLSYALPLIAGFKASIDPKVWSETSGWPEIASRLMGTWHGHPLGIWLGSLTAFVALLSAWALFNSQLLYISRLPAAMAQDGFLPKHFRKNSDDTGVPVLSLICASIAAILFCGLTIGKLMVVDVLLGFVGLSLEFMSLIALRVKEPNAIRPFRVPLSTNGLVLMSIAPFLIAMTVVISSAVGEDGSYVQLGIVAAVMILGVPLYYMTRRNNGLAKTNTNLTSQSDPEHKQNLQS
jgi:amino acid transporter